MLEGELLVVDEFGTSLGQAFVFLRSIEDEWDRGFWSQHLARMRLIGHDPDAAMGLAGRRPRRVEDGPMAEVHPVKGTKCEVDARGVAHPKAMLGTASCTGIKHACNCSRVIAPSSMRVLARSIFSEPESVRRSMVRCAPGPSLRPRS